MNAETDLVWPTIFMDDLSADVQLLRASAQLEGYAESAISGQVTLIGLWDGRPLSCCFVSESSDTDEHLNAASEPPTEPLRVEIMDTAQNVAATIRVGKPVSADLKWGLFGYSLLVSLIPLEEHVHVSHDRNDDLVKTVTANLLNVPSYKGSNMKVQSDHGWPEMMPVRLRFTGGGWKITIDDSLFWSSRHVVNEEASAGEDGNSQLWRNRHKALNQVHYTGGTLITHGIRIERENGAIFGLDRASTIIDRLEKFLSFIFGRRTRPLHAHGCDLNGSRKWAVLDVRPPLPVPNSPPFARSWLPQVTSQENWRDPAYSGVDLSSAFEGFMALASKDPATLTILARAIDWYEAALAFFGGSASVVLAQAGLELLAWKRITAEMKLSEIGREKLDVSDQLHLLLSGTGLTHSIPKELAELSKKNISGPVAVTRARNEVVHPKGTSLFTIEQATEAQSLALWYLEMSVLWMIGYQGEYWDRLAKENRIVPWR